MLLCYRIMSVLYNENMKEGKHETFFFCVFAFPGIRDRLLVLNRVFRLLSSSCERYDLFIQRTRKIQKIKLRPLKSTATSKSA